MSYLSNRRRYSYDEVSATPQAHKKDIEFTFYQVAEINWFLSSFLSGVTRSLLDSTTPQRLGIMENGGPA